MLGEVYLRCLLDVGTTNAHYSVRRLEWCGEKLLCKNFPKLDRLTAFAEWVGCDLVESDRSGLDGFGGLLLASKLIQQMCIDKRDIEEPKE